MIRIAVNGIGCSYGCFPALDGITFEIARGDFTGIIGPNGSGKSTLLRAMSRVLKPSRGAVLLDGRDIYSEDPRSVARRLAVVENDGRSEFGFTVLELVLMGRIPHLGRFQRESAADVETARRCLASTGILHLESRKITEISAGERQRALIARALVQEPEILLMDEPTSFLDIGYQVDVMDLVSRLSRENGLSVVVVLHDLNLASQYCKSIILMKDGRVFASGIPDDVVTPSNIREAYGSEVLVVRHPIHGRPHVIVLPRPDPAVARRGSQAGIGRVHVIGGGAMATRLMDMLSARGFALSAGALNAGDGDWAEARTLGANVIDVPPFCPVTEADMRRNVEAMKGALAVVLADIPFGPGNLRNLIAAAEAASMGIPLVIVEGSGVACRDYTGGQAVAMLQTLKSSQGGATRVVWCVDDEAAVRAVEDLAGERGAGRCGEGEL
ncbi:MAG: ABC transporter ATP-binding protein [Ignavibacteriales bacterium]